MEPDVLLVPLPEVVIGVVGVGIDLPSLPGVELRRHGVDVVDRLRTGPPAKKSRASPRTSRGRGKQAEHAFVIESSECMREVGALLDRCVQMRAYQGPSLLVAGTLPDAIADHALYARVTLYPRHLTSADALFHAIAVAAWVARDRIRREPELAIGWAVERLSPWLVAEHEGAITERQAHVLAAAGLGLNYREIAAALGIDRSTVEKHASEVMERIGVASFDRAAEPLSRRLAAAIGDGPAPPPRLPRDLRKTARDGNPVSVQDVTQVGTTDPRFRRRS